MAIFFDAPVTPDALTAFTREVPQDASLGLLNAFPRRDLDSHTVDFAELTHTNRAAKFRSFDGRIHVSERDAGSESRVKLLPLSSSLNMGEYERLQVEFARFGGTNTARLAQAVYNDAEQLTREVQNRLELAWGDVLVDGKLTINENGYQGEADFGLPAGHSVAPATLWADVANAKVLTDLIAWTEVYGTTNGGQPGAIRTSTRVIRLMQRNAEIIANVHGTTSGKGRVTRAELNDLLASEGLPQVVTPYDSAISVDNVITPVLPDDRLLLTPANLGDLGFTAWGVSATAMELVDSKVSEMSFEQAAGIVGVVEKVGPPYRQFTYVDAVAMPILSDARRLFVADVA